MFLTTSSLFAQELEVSQVEQANYYISSGWRQFNRNVDAFFTNQNYGESENKSTIYAYTSFYKKEGQTIEKAYDLQVRFDLPRTTKKLKIVIEKEQNEIVKALSDENVSRNKKNTKLATRYSETTENRYTAGADFFLPKIKAVSSFLKFGIRLDVPINPFVKFQMEKSFATKLVNINLSQTFLEYRQAGFQEITQAGFTRKWNEVFQSEFLNSLVWTDKNDAFDLRNSFGLYQSLGDEKTFSYTVGANAKLSPKFYYDSYDASITYRQLLFSKWFYGALTTGMDFPKSEGFNDEKFVQVKFELFFR